MSIVDSLIRPEVKVERAYLPNLGSFRIRLDANEAPPLLAPELRARIDEAFSAIALERYPDATTARLRAAIAGRHEVGPDEVLVGVGSDELLTILVTALSATKRAAAPPVVLTTTPTFVMYKMSARLRGFNVVEVPLDADWDLSIDGLLRAIEMASPNLVFIASPNNPTGNLMDAERLERVTEAASGALVVVDEAYVDYSDRDQFELYRKHENVVILRTLSKVGFAALRVGWLVGRAELVRELDKVRLPYNASAVVQSLGALILGELWPEIERGLSAVKTERARLTAELGAIAGLAVLPSQANFLWVKSEAPAERLFSGLAERGILVRSFHERGGRLAQQLRITVGSANENDELLAALRELV